MKPIRHLLTVCLVSLAVMSSVFTHQAWSQKTPQAAKRIQLNAENALIIREIGAVITEEKGTIKVMMVPPKDRLPEGVQAADIVAGDEVGMAGGKRVKTLKELRKAYEDAPIGEEFKIGVHRGGQAHVTTFVRKAEKDMPQGMQMIVRQGGLGGDNDSDMFPALGIGIERKGTEVRISEVLPHAPKGIEKGDVVKTLNGKKITSIKDFNEAFDATPIGGDLKLELSRGGAPVNVTAKRPEPRGPVIMRKN